MNWYRIKTILIFLFLAINLFLTSLLVYEQFAMQKAADRQLSTTIAVLEDAGIRVTAEKIPTKTRKLSSLTVHNPTADAEFFASRLLDGIPVRMGNTYRRDGKIVTITKTGFHYQSGLTPSMPNGNAEKLMQKALSEKGFSMEYASGETDGDSVSFTTKVHDDILYGCTMSVTPAGTEIAEIRGNWLEVQEIHSEKNTLIHCSDALIRFLQEPDVSGSTITCISSGFSVLVEDTDYKTADAVPVWRIETEGGKVYFYDARA